MRAMNAGEVPELLDEISGRGGAVEISLPDLPRSCKPIR